MKNVLYVVDSYNWALSSRANALVKYLPEHTSKITHFKEIKSRSDLDGFDIVYLLNWPIYGIINKYLDPRGKRSYRLITTVSSHVGRPKADKMAKSFIIYDAISTSSNYLYNEFKQPCASLGIKIFNTPFGVESDFFKPISDPSEYASVFGWVGNRDRDVKRFDVIEKIFALKDVKSTLKIATHKSGYGRQEMNKFYNSIGTLICFSTSEGTPNPILEAASCGRNIISTNVGNVPQLINRNKDIAIVSTEAALKKTIISTTSEQVSKNGIYLRDQIEQNWSWELRSRAFIEFIKI